MRELSNASWGIFVPDLPLQSYSSKAQSLNEATLEYATPVAREPRSSSRAVGLAPTLLAIGCGVISSFGFDDRITDSAGHDHAQLYISPLVYPFLLACLIAAVIGIARVMIPLVRDRRVSGFKAFLLLLNAIAIVIPLASMAHKYWASLLPLTFRSHGAPGGF